MKKILVLVFLLAFFGLTSVALASLTFSNTGITGDTSFNTLTIPGISTSGCLTINSSGVVSSTGVACGTGGSTTWGSITGTLSSQSDLNTALNGKQGILTLTTTGTSGAATLIGNTLNIPQYTGGTGTVTSISIASANGFAGTSNGGTTPTLTISTSVSGILKGNGTAISGATLGTDYSLGTALLSTGILKSTTTTGTLSIAVAGDFPTLNQNTTGYSSALKSATTTVDVSTATAPTSGQVLTATSGTAATWQTPTSSSSANAFLTVTDGSPITWNVGTIPNGIVVLNHTTATRALNLSGLTNGGYYALAIQQDNTGGAAMTLGTGCIWKIGGSGNGSISLSATANTTDILVLTYDGTNCYANIQTNFN